MSVAKSPRVLVSLIGDVDREIFSRVKYGHLIDALGRRLPVVGVHDASLRGVARWINALQVFTPNRKIWQQRFRKNLPAFRRRSQEAAAFMLRHQDAADVMLQIGVLFDASWGEASVPNVIYTDYTAAQSARKPEAGRAPFTPAQAEQWLAWETQAFQRAAHVTTRGQFVRDSLVSDYGLDSSRVTAIGGGLNFETLPEMPPQTDGKTVLFIGKNFHRKGGDLLLRAFAGVRTQIPDARLVLVTSGPIPDELPQTGVEVVEPTWDRSRIVELYRQADIFVLPSRLETWGDVLLEAMAYGIPCIGVTGEAMEDIIDHEKTGLVVAPGEVEPLQAALTRLVADIELQRAWGGAGRQRLEEMFTWDRVVDQLVPILEHAATRRSHG
jgi:starch synthase